jgi:hypothetical protein
VKLILIDRPVSFVCSLVHLWTRERHRTDATLDAFDGIARVNGKGKWILTRKRFQIGSVRLREDRGRARIGRTS